MNFCVVVCLFSSGYQTTENPKAEIGNPEIRFRAPKGTTRRDYIPIYVKLHYAIVISSA